MTPSRRPWEPDERRLWVVAGLLTLATVIAAFASTLIHRTKDWEEFKRAHKCEIIAHYNERVDVAGGTAAPAEPKECWRCDDDKIYCRDAE